jgi:hypothetical protein
MPVNLIYVHMTFANLMTQKHEFLGYSGELVHISIDEYSSDAFQYFDDNKWGSWDAGQPKLASGNCIVRSYGKMRLADCLTKLRFVCEV